MSFRSIFTTEKMIEFERIFESAEEKIKLGRGIIQDNLSGVQSSGLETCTVIMITIVNSQLASA